MTNNDTQVCKECGHDFDPTTIKELDRPFHDDFCSIRCEEINYWDQPDQDWD